MPGRKLKPYLIITKIMAGELYPIQRVFSLLDPLLRRTSLVVKTYDMLRPGRKIAYNKSHTGKKLSLMPFNFHYHAPELLP